MSGSISWTQAELDAWNEAHPVGTELLYFPIAGELNHRRVRTRSPAWLLGHGAPVVSVRGIAGGLPLSHLVVLAKEAEA